ncbi:hypothetical protein EWM64_g923 [Hericium alpestre]|uniref:MYND-type domain-containing protein n=1 Tax=Hericium alpestre TaxID=135208 RepID=A0A4Z0A9S1_9AGAM|nr:hypothetical protein EWM64_g923 [Hericium alpestre]
MSFKRFVLIMCFQPKHATNLDGPSITLDLFFYLLKAHVIEWTEAQQFADYDAQTQYQANRLMCLLNCLFTPASRPEWIRATWVTPDRMSLPPKLWLFSPDGPQTSETVNAERKPGTFFITPEILNPTLLPDEVRLMRWTQRPSIALLRSVVVSEGTPASKPSCGYCRRVTTTVGLKKCSGCKAVYYCGDDCQAEHWKQHKSLCKAYARGQ